MAVLGAALPVQAQCEYTVLHVLPDGPPCSPTNTYGPVIFSIADDGSVCGYASAGVCGTDRPFIWSPGDATLTLLPFPPGMVTGRAMDLNENGVVVGWCAASMSGNPQPCVWLKGVPALLPMPPGAVNGEALAINDSGVVVGYSQNGGIGPRHAVRWEGRVVQDIHPTGGWNSSVANDVNSVGTIIGRVSTGLQVSLRGVIWDAGNVTILPPIQDGVNSRAVAVNNGGVVAGVGETTGLGQPGNAVRSFIWTNGTMADLGTLPGLSSCVIADINDAAQVFGYCFGGAPSRSIVWKSGHLATIDVDGIAWEQQSQAINNSGLFVIGRRVFQPLPKPPYDIDQNCTVNVNDLLAVIVDWGSNGSPADCNVDGVVSAEDLLLVLVNWG